MKLLIMSMFAILVPCAGNANVCDVGASSGNLTPQGLHSIHQIFLDDQIDRSHEHSAIACGTSMSERDATRRVLARRLLVAGTVRTGQDFHDAAFIFQHGITPSDYLLAHILAVDSIIKGDGSSKWIAAATLDRYLQAIGQKQIFGTQYTGSEPGTAGVGNGMPRVARGGTHQQRKLTENPFDEKFISDILRKDFCVPDIAHQRINLKQLESGHIAEGIVPQGCTR